MPQRAGREHLQSDGGGQGVGGNYQLLLQGEREEWRMEEGGTGDGGRRMWSGVRSECGKKKRGSIRQNVRTKGRRAGSLAYN